MIDDEHAWRRWTLAEEPAKDEAAGQRDEPTEDPVTARDRKIQELTDDLKRLQAEYENYKKRVEREWTERSKLGIQRLMTDLLAVLDSFDKALEDASDCCDAESVKKGLEGLHKQLLQTLQREGLREIKADGRFDPFMHEALMREERDDVEEGQVLEVYQKGYAVGQKAIRPARVKVAMSKPAGPEAEEEPQHSHEDNHDQKDKENTQKR